MYRKYKTYTYILATLIIVESILLTYYSVLDNIVSVAYLTYLSALLFVLTALFGIIMINLIQSRYFNTMMDDADKDRKLLVYNFNKLTDCPGILYDNIVHSNHSVKDAIDDLDEYVNQESLDFPLIKSCLKNITVDLIDLSNKLENNSKRDKSEIVLNSSQGIKMIEIDSDLKKALRDTTPPKGIKVPFNKPSDNGY